MEDLWNSDLTANKIAFSKLHTYSFTSQYSHSSPLRQPSLSCLLLCFPAVTLAEVTQAHEGISRMITLLSIHNFCLLSPAAHGPHSFNAWLDTSETDNAAMLNGNKRRSCPVNNSQSINENKALSSHLLFCCNQHQIRGMFLTQDLIKMNKCSRSVSGKYSIKSWFD